MDAMPRLKRKTSLSDFLFVEEGMKKCKITVSPGELRLKADLAECRDLVAAGKLIISPNSSALVSTRS
jgi:hypothetical protein